MPKFEEFLLLSNRGGEKLKVCNPLTHVPQLLPTFHQKMRGGLWSQELQCFEAAQRITGFSLQTSLIDSNKQ